jgi:hydroxypyruvate reductase
MLERGLAETVFAEAVAACDPAARVLAALADVPAGDRRLGIAIGKAALAMARGAGPVAHGVAIAPADDGAALPAGWRVRIAPHPVPDHRSVAAAEAAWRIADREARAGDVLLVLISGGASSLIEAPRDGVTLDELRTTIAALMAAGAPIADLNVVRSALSRVKAGGLIAHCPTRAVTLAISDVIGDDLATIGSGPTISNAAPLSPRAVDALDRHGIAVPPVLFTSEPSRPPRIGDIARVIAPMTAFADAAITALAARGIHAIRLDPPIAGDVAIVAAELAARSGFVVAWGEPTLSVPADHGEGGRAQQLALELARRIRGTHRGAMCIGSDGNDGPASAARPTPAGAFVDGTTWDAIITVGIDPDAALARRDAGTALAAVDALVVTGPTGINHADLVLLG